VSNTEPAEPLISWLTLTDWHEASSVVETLTDWLERVYLRYSDVTLASCWAWHPDVVEELWWLHNAWLDAYQGSTSSWEKVGVWHDRYRPGVAKRIADKLGTCGLELHAEPAGPPPAVPLLDALPHVVTAWTSPLRTAWPPAPATSQLKQARHHHDELGARRRRWQ
jgi:hypothetical protein